MERFGDDLLTSGRDALLEERVSKRLQDGLQQARGVQGVWGCFGGGVEDIQGVLRCV